MVYMRGGSAMNKDNTFTLEDLDTNFWESLIFFKIQHSSGIGGPGCLWLITSDVKLYFIGFEGFPYSERRLEEFHPLFERISDENEKYKSHLKAEDIGFVKHPKETVCIKEKYYNAYCQEWQKEWDNNVSRIHYVHAPTVMAQTLGLDKIDRYDWEISVKKQEEYYQWRQQCEEKHKQRELSEEYFEWNPLYLNNHYEDCYDERGWYCVLLKEVEKKIVGTRFTIMYQREELAPLKLKGLDAPIEKYILFEKHYSDVIGRLRFPDSKESDRSREEYGLTNDIQHTLNDMDLNDRGEFIRAFDSLEEAKNYAIVVANIRNYANMENIVAKEQLDDFTRTNASLERKYKAIVMLKKYVLDIINFVAEYEYPSENQAGGVSMIAAEKLGIDEELMQEMWQYIPMELLPRTQRKAEKILQDIRSRSGK